MENQRLILYVSLALVLFVIWQTWQQDYGTAATATPAGESPARQESTAQSDLAEDQPPAADMPGAAATTPGVVPSTDERAGTIVHIITDVLDVDISTSGGDLIRADLITYPVSVDQPDVPFRLLDDTDRIYLAQTGLVHDRIQTEGVDARKLAPSHHATFAPEQTSYRLAEGSDEIRVPMTWSGPDGIRVTKTFTFRRGSFVVDIDQQVENGSSRPWTGRQYRQIRHAQVLDEDQSKFVRTFTGAAYYDGKFQKVSFDDIAEEPLSVDITGGWVAVLQHYFVSAFVDKPDSLNLVYTKAVQGRRGPEFLVGLRSEAATAAPGEKLSFNTRFFMGPKLQKQLSQLAPGLDLVTDYGIFTVISKPLFWLLEHIHNLVGNWGWAIILLTVLIKLVFYKLSEASYRSMAKMRAVQPRMAALKERFGDDKQRMNQALMELYKKEKINPLGGCLPILVQIPVFIALYWTLLESVELRQAPFVLWIQDLSTKDPFYVLPVVMGITMLIQQRLNPTPLDPIQAKVMMVLPLVFTVFFAFFPSGLVLYWVVNNTLSIIQQWVITRRIAGATAAKT